MFVTEASTSDATPGKGRTENVMADTKSTKVANYAIIERSISAGKDKAKPVTKDGNDHKAGAVVVHMAAATDAASFAANWTALQAQIAAVESGQPFTVVTSKGVEGQKSAVKEFVDGKNVFASGKDIYPTTFAELVDFINATIDAKAAAKLTAFNNTHKIGYGAGGGTTVGVESLDEIA